MVLGEASAEERVWADFKRVPGLSPRASRLLAPASSGRCVLPAGSRAGPRGVGAFVCGGAATSSTSRGPFLSRMDGGQHVFTLTDRYTHTALVSPGWRMAHLLLSLPLALPRLGRGICWSHGLENLAWRVGRISLEGSLTWIGLSSEHIITRFIPKLSWFVTDSKGTVDLKLANAFP